MKKVYLAGPIFGQADKGQTWREEAMRKIPPGWRAINPLIVEFDKTAPEQIILVDYQTILFCDAIIARTRNPSWGTAMEIQFAKQYGIPVIGFPFLRPPIIPNYSPWLIHHVTVFAASLDDALGELKHVGVHHNQLPE